MPESNPEIPLKNTKIKTQTDSMKTLQTYSETSFVLVNKESYGNLTPFGDILPIYGSYQKLSNVIVTSTQGLLDMVVNSSEFINCFLTFFNQLSSSVAYESYLVLTESYQQITYLPERYKDLKIKFVDFIQVFVDAQVRDLWWLETKIETRLQIDSLLSFLSNSLVLVQKFYLSFIIIACLGFLNFGSLNSYTSSGSFLSRYLQQNSQNGITVQSATEATSLSSFTTVGNRAAIQIISKHEVQPGETVAKIASLYSLSPDTVAYNNSLSKEEIANLPLGKNLYLPWLDGYIYNSVIDISPDTLAQRYGVDKDQLIAQNAATINPENGKFKADSLVLIPTADFAKVDQINKKEKDREDTLKKAEAQRQSAISNSAIARSTSGKSSIGIIWPTVGVISRCIEPGHQACDIANPSAPAILAAKDGVVSAVYRYTVVGYGLAVVIDHGGGVKTLYAHMSDIWVTAGQKVSQGEGIGKMGCTGMCTGTHLHFEVIINGVRQNPMDYLP